MSVDPVTAAIMREVWRRAARGLLARWRRLRWEAKAALLLAVFVGTPAGLVTLYALAWLSYFGANYALPAWLPAPAGAQGQRAAIAPAVLAWEPLAERIAAERGLDPALVLAVIQAESGGDPLAVSPAGALGLIQVMPDKFGPGEDPFDPEANLRAGCSCLRRMLDRYGDLELALAAYNSGPGAVDRWGGVPPYPETVAYVERVMLLYAEMSENPDRPVREAAPAPGAAAGARPAEAAEGGR